MIKKYSVWQAIDDDSNCLSLCVGIEAPRFLNGEPQCENPILRYTIDAGSNEEAMAIFHLRQGWEPYKPEGEAEPCPACGEFYYPHGSGECWSCDYKN